MNKHIYAFGSICRGETDSSSDIDLLLCVSKPSSSYDSKMYSIYTYKRLRELWLQGNPFSWHLYLESKPLFLSDGTDFLSDLGKPDEYRNAVEDCNKFYQLFMESYRSIVESKNSAVFHLSCMFLAARNFATCYSLKFSRPVFSRLSPLLIEEKVSLDSEEFDIYVRARILSTRGYGKRLSKAEIEKAVGVAPVVMKWMKGLLSKGVLT